MGSVTGPRQLVRPQLGTLRPVGLLVLVLPTGLLGLQPRVKRLIARTIPSL
jgi:hypothetical protein